MASASDNELEYLSPSFEPSSITVPRLRAILVSHDIAYPASAKKQQLIDIFTKELVPRSRRILAARSRTRRTSRGITDMPSSQEGTVNGDDDGNSSLMPPPPVPDTQRRRSRRSETRSSEDNVPNLNSGKRTSLGRTSTSKHPRASDTETDPEAELQRPLVRRTRRSEVTPTVKIEAPEDTAPRPPLVESAFSHDNPFQSGSSPLTPSESRRRSRGASNDRRKSSSRRRRAEGPNTTESKVKHGNGVVVPSVKTFELPAAKLKKITKTEEDLDDGVEFGEDFTPEEQLELVRERAANGEIDILQPRKKKPLPKSRGVSKSAPWVVLTTLLAGYATWWRREKLEVGYCGIGRSSTSLSSVQIPDWATLLQPSCEPCPQHAYCYANMETRCEQAFLLQPHPLSLGGLVPLPPTCEPDGEKARKVKAVADRAIDELRERRAKWECGNLVDEKGKDVPIVEIDEEILKKEVGKKRRRGMSETEFEELWKGALGEIIGREEVLSDSEGHRLTSTSLARLPLTCTIRRSARLALARHRLTLAILILILTSLAYTRTRISNLRADNARVPLLVSTTLDRLATQAALHAQGAASEAWISAGQLRDDVLRDEFSATRREGIWRKVKGVVEMNANVRASVREGRGGDVSRVWEWIGSVGLLEDARFGGGERRVSGAVVAAAEGRGGQEMVEQRKWDEGRPVY